MSQATIDQDQIVRITGYRQPSKQLEELHRQGFWRARRSRLDGSVILEAAHYESVCKGESAPARETRRPKLQPV